MGRPRRKPPSPGRQWFAVRRFPTLVAVSSFRPPKHESLVAALGNLGASLSVRRKAEQRHEDTSLAGDVGAEIPGIAGRIDGAAGDRVDVRDPLLLGPRARLDGGLAL